MRRLRRLTAFEIDLGFDSFTGQCYAEVRTIGVICVGPSETEALGRLVGVVLRIMADRLEQGREVPDVKPSPILEEEDSAGRDQSALSLRLSKVCLSS